MVSTNKKSVKKFASTGKKITKKYTDCVKYVKNKGAQVEEPEITEVELEPESSVEPEDPEMEEELEMEEPESPVEPEEPEMEEEEEEEEEESNDVVKPFDFSFTEPSEFKLPQQLINGDRVVEVDPLDPVNVSNSNSVNTPAIEMEVKSQPKTPKKKEPKTPKGKKSKRGKHHRKKSNKNKSKKKKY